MTQDNGEELPVRKVFQYQTYETENINRIPLDLIAEYVIFYPKSLSAGWFPYPKSFNFVWYDSSGRFKKVLLVVLSKTFNISEKIGPDRFVLCSANVLTHKFILLFPSDTHADKFYESVEHDLNDQIPCPGGWVMQLNV